MTLWLNNQLYRLRWDGIQIACFAWFWCGGSWYQEYWIGLDLHWKGKGWHLSIFDMDWFYRWQYQCDMCGKRGNRCNCEEEMFGSDFDL